MTPGGDPTAVWLIVAVLVPAVVALYGFNVWVVRAWLADKDRQIEREREDSKALAERLYAQTDKSAALAQTADRMLNRFLDREDAPQKGGAR